MKTAWTHDVEETLLSEIYALLEPVLVAPEGTDPPDDQVNVIHDYRTWPNKQKRSISMNVVRVNPIYSQDGGPWVDVAFVVGARYDNNDEETLEEADRDVAAIAGALLETLSQYQDHGSWHSIDIPQPWTRPGNEPTVPETRIAPCVIRFHLK